MAGGRAERSQSGQPRGWQQQQQQGQGGEQQVKKVRRPVLPLGPPVPNIIIIILPIGPPVPILFSICMTPPRWMHPVAVTVTTWHVPSVTCGVLVLLRALLRCSRFAGIFPGIFPGVCTCMASVTGQPG